MLENLGLRAKKLWYGLTNPGYWRGLCLGVAPSVEHKSALENFSFDTVVDVGANKGQFAMFSRVCFPQSQIISFEPLDRPARMFQSLFRGDGGTRLIQAALSTKRGPLLMQVTAQDDSSSPLMIGELQGRLFGTKLVSNREVQSGPLSDFVQEGELGARSLLKIDTQGFELEVLRGAESMLHRFSAVYCELSFVELYLSQPLASDVISYLFHHGFNLAGVYNITSKRILGQIQADMLFMRRNQLDNVH